ncbi:hypothetical protein R1sor_016319 [Riccia sorocarpa]|uniref:Uncharacterized protein n=1 Tax=Riccia sorocarpa TaxID=122646 RepID=A0ABD3HI60_9MARC
MDSPGSTSPADQPAFLHGVEDKSGSGPSELVANSHDQTGTILLQPGHSDPTKSDHEIEMDSGYEFLTTEGPLYVHSEDRLDVEARAIAGTILNKRLQHEDLLDRKLAQQFGALSSYGLSQGALHRWAEMVAAGPIADPIHCYGTQWCREGTPIKHVRIPAMFTSIVDDYANQPQRIKDFWEGCIEGRDMSAADWQRTAAYLIDNSEFFWGTPGSIDDCGSVPGKAGKSVSDIVVNAHNQLSGPEQIMHTSVVSEGSNIREWVVQCGDQIASSRRKKEAQVIARVKYFIDSNFDGSQPLVVRPGKRRRHIAPFLSRTLDGAQGSVLSAAIRCYYSRISS